MTRRRLVVALLLVVGVATAYAARGRWLPAAARALDVGGPPRRADYAFVAAGDVQTRPHVAALLFQYRYVDKILLTRPPRHAGSARTILEYDELARAMLEHEGVPADRVEVLVGDVSSTMDEARLLAARLRAESEARFLLVTSDYHTRRLRWAVRRAAPDAGDRVQAFAAPVEEFHAENWWRTENGPATYVSEYLHLAFYHVRYGAAGYVLAALVVAGATAVVARRYLRRDFFARRGAAGRNSASSAA